MRWAVLIAVWALASPPISEVSLRPRAFAADKVTKETFGHGGKTRTYYLLVPESAKKQSPAPLLVMLHGSTRIGKSLTDHWESLAKKEGIILAAPDSIRREGWDMVDDGPDFLYALVEMLRIQHDVDPRRIYLFGHSAGAIQALTMAVLESEYFAAVAAHAGTLPPGVVPYIERTARKTPVGIWVGTEDPQFPLNAVRATRDALNAHGFGASLTEIRGHTHQYYDRASDINKQVWAFLQTQKLEADPKFQRYEIPR